jgi:hypothetical protein
MGFRRFTGRRTLSRMAGILQAGIGCDGRCCGPHAERDCHSANRLNTARAARSAIMAAEISPPPNQEVLSVPAKFFECRSCGSLNGYRSRPRGMLEKYLLSLFFLRPVRCGGCSRRTFQSRLVPVQERPQTKCRRAAAA